MLWSVGSLGPVDGRDCCFGRPPLRRLLYSSIGLEMVVCVVVCFDLGVLLSRCKCAAGVGRLWWLLSR